VNITRLETLRLGEFPNLVWVRVHTDGGLAGLGETSFAAEKIAQALA
jgi:galactonate dehydratase